MKRWMVAAGVALVLGAAPARAQTRVDVVVGVGAPQPFVSGVIVVGRPYFAYARRAYFYRPPLFVERVYVVRHHHRRAYHRYRDYDDDE